jgi:chromosome partitioning protein
MTELTTNETQPDEGSMPAHRRPYIVAVVAYKGGVGKTEFAYELAWLLDAILVDFEWDLGSATRKWGYRYEDRIRVPILDALDRGHTPTPLHGFRKPPLIPGHPELGAAQYPEEHVTAALETWAKELGRPLVIDNHPGGVPTTRAAAAAADVIVSPTVLATRELEALGGMLDEMPDYPLIIAPNKVPAVPPAAELAKLERMVTKAGVRVAPPVSNYPWLPRRKIRVAITSYEPVPARIAQFDQEMRAVARMVHDYVTTT